MAWVGRLSVNPITIQLYERSISSTIVNERQPLVDIEIIPASTSNHRPDAPRKTVCRMGCWAQRLVAMSRTSSKQSSLYHNVQAL